MKNKLREDHQLHLLVGLFMGLGLSVHFGDVLLAFVFGSMVAVLKEVVWDEWLGRGTLEVSDIFWTIVGVIGGCCLWGFKTLVF